MVSIKEAKEIKDLQGEGSKGKYTMIQYMQTDELVRRKSGFNPPMRTKQKYLKRLMASIEKYGIQTPILLDGSGKIADGHRRLQCAAELGIKEIPTIQSVLCAEDLYATTNDAQKKTGSSEWWQAVVNGFPIEKVPGISVRRTIERLGEVLTPNEFMHYGGKGMATSNFHIARRMGTYISEGTEKHDGLGLEYRNDEWLRRYFIWLTEKQMSNPARKAMEVVGVSPSLLVQAVEKDIALKETFTL